MSVLNQTDFLHPSIEESLPMTLNYKPQEANSVITDRQTVRINPLSGTTFGDNVAGALSQMSFRINTGKLVDPRTVMVHFNYQALGENGAEIADTDGYLDDWAWSVFDSIRVKVGGTTVEQLDHVGEVMSLFAAHTLPKDFAVKQGNAYMGHYNYSGLFFDAPAQHAAGSYAIRTRDTVQANGWARFGQTFAVPLVYCCGVFKNGKLLPPNLDINIEINLASVNDCHVQPADHQNIRQYKLTNVFLEYDEVSVIQQWYASYNTLIRSPNQKGLMIPIDTFEVIESVIPAGADSGSYLVSKGARDLRTVYVAFRRLADLADGATTNVLDKKNNRWSGMGLSQYQFSLAGKKYPVDPCDSRALMYTELQKAFNTLNHIDSGSLVDYKLYNAANDLNNNLSATNDMKFMVGQNFDRSNETPWSGVNLAEQGYQLTFFWTATGTGRPSQNGAAQAGGAYQALNILHMMKQMTLMNEKLMVQE
jgi:hypothetical protein